MVTRVLLLGGTREARDLAGILSAAPEFEVVSSLAGRVGEPVLPVGEVRIGGFGGANGLRAWLAAERVGVVVDATHPFAATMSEHAAAATAALGLPLLRLCRPGWTAGPGDRWTRVPDLAAAAETVAAQGKRVFLTIGRQGVGAFATLPQWFLIRAIDPPADYPAEYELLLARGPFTVEDEIALLTNHRIDLMVTKDSGGDLTSAKLTAARAQGVPVVMIDRPALPPGGRQIATVADAATWLRHRLQAGG